MVLVPKADPLLLDGQPVNEPQTLKPFQRFTIGDSEFAIGPSGQPWPEMKPMPRTDAKPEPQPEKKTVAQPAPAPLPTPAKAAPKAASRGFSAAFILAISSFGLIGAIIISLLSIQTIPPPQSDSLIPDLQKVLAPYADVTMVNDGIAVSIVGYVRTNDERSKLIKALQNLDGANRLRINIFSDESILQSARTTLAGTQLPLTAQVTGPGRMVLSGSVPEQGTLDRARRLLLSEVIGLRDIDISGVVIGSATKRWGRSGDDEPTVALQIASITTGPLPWLTLSDGSRYFEGSVLPNGYEIQRIFPDRIRLTRDGEVVELTTSQDNLWNQNPP
jgi:type III secretion protein D